MISAEFKRNVQSGDLLRVRSSLIDYLIIDRSFQKFDEALDFALHSLPVLQEHDGEVFEEDSGQWDKRYLNFQKAALMNNFSEERIQHLKQVIRAVMPPAEQIACRENSFGQMQKRNSRTGRTVINEVPAERKRKSGRKSGKNLSSEYNAENSYGKFLIAGGVAVAAVGILQGEMILTAVGVVVAGVGCVAKVQEKGK